jgi:hypothetical protein
MNLGKLFDKALAAVGLVVNLVRDFPSLRALREDGQRLRGDIREAWAQIEVDREHGPVVHNHDS